MFILTMWMRLRMYIRLIRLAILDTSMMYSRSLSLTHMHVFITISAVAVSILLTIVLLVLLLRIVMR